MERNVRAHQLDLKDFLAKKNSEKVRPDPRASRESMLEYICELILKYEQTLPENGNIDATHYHLLKAFEQKTDPVQLIGWNLKDFRLIYTKIFSVVKRNSSQVIERRNCIMYLVKHSDILKEVKKPEFTKFWCVEAPSSSEQAVGKIANENPGSSNAGFDAKSSTPDVHCGRNVIFVKSNQLGTVADVEGSEGSKVECNPDDLLSGTSSEMLENPLFTGSAETDVVLKKEPSSDDSMDSIEHNEKKLLSGQTFYVHGTDTKNLEGVIQEHGGVVSSEISEDVHVICTNYLHGKYTQSLADLLKTFKNQTEVKVYMGELIYNSIENGIFDFLEAYSLDAPAETATQKGTEIDEPTTQENAHKKRKLADDTKEVHDATEPGNPNCQSMIGKLYPFKPSQPKVTAFSSVEIDYMDFILDSDDETEKEDETRGGAVNQPSIKDEVPNEQGKTQHDSAAEFVLNVYSQLITSGAPKYYGLISRISKEINKKWCSTVCIETTTKNGEHNGAEQELFKTEPEDEDANGPGRTGETTGKKGVLVPQTIRNHIHAFVAQMIGGEKDEQDEMKKKIREERKLAVLKRGVPIEQLEAVLEYLNANKSNTTKSKARV